MPLPPTELAVLASTGRQPDIRELARDNAIPYPTAFAAVRTLETRGLVVTRREGKLRLVQAADPSLPGLARTLLFESPRPDLNRIFHGERLLHFHALQKVRRPELVAEVTGRTKRAVYKTLSAFAPAGFLVKTNATYQLHPRQSNYWRFIDAVARLEALRLARSASPTASLIWYLGPEALFKTEDEIDSAKATRAGFDRFAEFDLELVSGELRTYHVARRELDAADAIFEAILASGDTPTHRSYCALLLESKRPPRLLEKAEIYGLGDFARALHRYVETQDASPGFLPWKEHERYRRQYLGP